MEETREVAREKELKARLEKCIDKATHSLYMKDKNLVGRGVGHVSERSIMFRFALYLQEFMSKDPYLKHYDIDCEYNRNGKCLKTLPSWQQGCVPDIIVHRRETNSDNLLIIECKAGPAPGNNTLADDIVKIQEFILSDVYHYTYGLAIWFGPQTDEKKWFDRDTADTTGLRRRRL